MVKQWDTALIGDFLEFKNGLNKGKEFFGYGTPIVNYTDVYKKRGLKASDIRGRVFLTTDEIHRFEVRKNDVFFTRTSETPDEVGMTSVLLEDIDDCVFSGFVLRGRPKNNMFEPEYCKYCFSTEAVRNAIITGCTYTTRALTNGKQLCSIEIAFPPKPEQKAIATALSDIDALIANLEKLIAKKKAIKQGAMQELLTGKRRLPGFDGEWINIPIKQIGDVVTGSTPSRQVPQYWGGSFPWISAQDFCGKYICKSVETITEEGMKTCRLLPEGSVLITCIASIGRNAVATVECATNQQINAVICHDGYHNELIYYVICHSTDRILQLAGQTAVPIISKTQFEEFVVYIPQDTNEQVAIALVLADMDEEIYKFEELLLKYRGIKSGMMSELLTGRIRLIDKEES